MYGFVVFRRFLSLSGREINRFLAESNAATIPRVLDLFARHGDTFSRVNVVTAFHVVAKNSRALSPPSLVLLHGDGRFRRLWKRIEREIEAGSIDRAHLASITWSAGMLRVRAPSFVAHLSRQVKTHVSGMKAREFCFVAHGLAHLSGTRNKRIFEVLQKDAMSRIDGLGPFQLSMLVWAFARVGHRSDDFLGKCVDRAEVLCDDFLPKSVGVMAWSFAVLHYPVPTLLSRFSRLALDQIDEYSVQAISNLLWSGAVFRTLNEKLTGTVFAKLNHVLNDIGARACPKETAPSPTLLYKNLDAIHSMSQLGNKSLSSIYQVDIELASLGMESLGFSNQSRSLVLTHLTKRRRTRPSLFQSAVRDVLLELGLKPFPEYETGFYSVDFALFFRPSLTATDVTFEGLRRCVSDGGEETSAARVAVEVDGPAHFGYSKRLPLGHTVMKRRQLAQMGWKTVSILYWEWNALDDVMRKQFVAEMIIRALSRS